MADQQALIAAGVGCRAACSVEDIVAVVLACLARHGRTLGDVRALCTADFKSPAEQLQRAAAELGTRLVLVPRAALERHAGQTLSSSARVVRLFDLPSIAETAALAGAFELSGGSDEVRLIGPRQGSAVASCALASFREPLA